MDFELLYQLYRDQLIILFHVGVAVLLGGVIGVERELKKRPAGFRTHMLVAGVAALFTDLAAVLVLKADEEMAEGVLNIDPVRIVVAIATGISFLGAGTIFRSADGISGLTTASTLLMASALGIAVALEQYVLAVGTTLMVLVVLQLFGAVREKIAEEADSNDTAGPKGN